MAEEAKGVMIHKPKKMYCACPPLGSEDSYICDYCEYSAYMDQEYDRRREDFETFAEPGEDGDE